MVSVDWWGMVVLTGYRLIAADGVHATTTGNSIRTIMILAKVL